MSSLSRNKEKDKLTG